MEENKLPLTAENVDKIFRSCLYEHGEDTSKHVVFEGLRMKAGFDPERIKANDEKINQLIDQLPNSFKDGDSFLNACVTSNGIHWGEHSDIDLLLTMGLAIDRIYYPFPKDMWNSLPGSMPYLTIKQS